MPHPRTRLAALITAFGVSACGDSGETTRGSSRERPLAASTRPGDPPTTQPGYVGVLIPARAADIAAPQTGWVESVPAKLGEVVTEKSPLVRLNVDLAALDRARAEAGVVAMEAAVERAALERTNEAQKADRIGRLSREGLVAGQDLENAGFERDLGRFELAEAQAKLRERRAELARLKVLEAQTVVRAPFAGVVATRYVEPGSSVVAGAPLVRVIGDGSALLRFAIPLGDETRVKANTPVWARSTVRGGVTLPAIVERLGPELDRASRMRIVEARLKDPARALDTGLIGAIVEVWTTEPPARGDAP